MINTYCVISKSPNGQDFRYAKPVYNEDWRELKWEKEDQHGERRSSIKETTKKKTEASHPKLQQEDYEEGEEIKNCQKNQEESQ